MRDRLVIDIPVPSAVFALSNALQREMEWARTMRPNQAWSRRALEDYYDQLLEMFLALGDAVRSVA